MLIAISGATGLIGSALAASLMRDGHVVNRLSRTPRTRGEFAFDPERAILDTDALDDADAIVHLAGEPIAQRWNAEVRRRIMESRALGTRMIAEAVARLPEKPRVLVSGSAIGIYGDRGNEALTETSAPGDDFLAEVCRAWESAADPARSAGVRVVHPRIGVVLARDGGALERLLPPFRLGLGGRIGSGSQWMSWISLADAVNGLRFMIDHEALEGPVNLVGPAPATNAELTRELAAALHRPAFIPVPAFALRVAFNEMADATLIASQRVQPARLQEAGFTFVHPTLGIALRDILA